jgi:hypothetical protein
MTPTNDFVARLERKVKQQLSSQRVGYLLGAGSSYLNGYGYPLMTNFWDLIRGEIPLNEQAEIQVKLDAGADGIETALDLLDDGGIHDTPHRHLVTKAIAEHFCKLTPALDVHANFLKRISQRSDEVIPIFNLNYDPLLERAAELSRLRLIDGFVGAEHAYYDSTIFQQRLGVVRRSWRGRHFNIIQGNIHLYKLHGSLGWYESKLTGVRRCGFALPVPAGTKRLMIPPQRRKATDTISNPYSSLWSELRAFIRHGPFLVNRLVSIGYGMRDEHVNDVIKNGLVRSDFTLMIFARDLKEEVFTRWSQKKNVVIITNQQCSLNGEIGPGHPNLWDFEQLSKEV